MKSPTFFLLLMALFLHVALFLLVFFALLFLIFLRLPQSNDFNTGEISGCRFRLAE